MAQLMTKREESRGDPEWVALVREKLARHGAKKDLATALGVHPSTITRMAKGGYVSPGVLYRASVELGIRPPTTIPLDPLQQRVMKALVIARTLLSDSQAEVFVTEIEAKAEQIREAWRAVLIDVHNTRREDGGWNPKDFSRWQDLIPGLRAVVGKADPEDIASVIGKLFDPHRLDPVDEEDEDDE